jgi:hypothetical protein
VGRSRARKGKVERGSTKECGDDPQTGVRGRQGTNYSRLVLSLYELWGYTPRLGTFFRGRKCETGTK